MRRLVRVAQRVGIVPFGRLAIVRLFDERPEIDPSGHVRFERLVLGRGRESGFGFVAEDAVDKIQHRLGRAERELELLFNEWPSRFLVLAAEMVAHLREPFRRGSLETEYRLLFVSDGEHGPVQGSSGAFARREFLGEPADDVPLDRTDVLRLVNQDVVDAAVQPVQHPARGFGIGKQRAGFQDEVVEIQQRRRALLRVERCEQRVREPMQGSRLFRGRDADPGVPHRGDPFHEGVQLRFSAERFSHLLGREPVDFGSERLFRGGSVQEDGLQYPEIPFRGVRRVDPLQPGEGGQVGRASVPEHASQVGKKLAVSGREHPARERADACAFNQAEHFANPAFGILAPEKMPL